MDMRKYSGPHHIVLNDVLDGPVRGRITSVEEDEKYGRPVLVFESGEKFSLNSTNNKILMRAYGNQDIDWIDKEIELYAGEVEFQKKMQPSVIVRPISAADKDDGKRSISAPVTVDNTELEPNPFEGPGPTRNQRPNEQRAGPSLKDFDDDIPY
jgi:hypothetical protein